MTIEFSTVKSRFNEWPPSAHFDSLNLDYSKLRLFNVKLRFGHNIMYLILRLMLNQGF